MLLLKHQCVKLDHYGSVNLMLVTFSLVVLVMGVGGHYKLTLAGARRECISRGLRLADSTELLQARAAGFHFCGCGWMDDGTRGFVLQYEVPFCISFFHTGILKCDWLHLLDAYCII